MRSFEFKREYTKLLTPDIVALLTQIHEYKVQQNLFIEVNQDALSELIETAKIQSSEASNRIEGIIITENRLKKLVQDKTIPKNRSEREIAGYRDVLSIIQENYEYIPIRPGMILQLHRDLYKYIGTTVGGNFKNSDNVIVIKRLKGGAGERRLSDQYQGKVNNLSLQLSKINEKKERLYENMVEGILEEEEYQFAKKQYESEYQRLQVALDEARKTKDSFDKVMSLDTDWMQAVKGLGNMDELSADVVKAIVARVSIFEGKRVQIDLKYHDKAAEVAAIVDALKEADEHE